MKLPLLALFAGLVAITATPASALPAAKAAGVSIETPSSVETVQYRPRAKQRLSTEPRRMNRGDRWNRGNSWDRGDRRYYKYRNWNRYDSRPRGWRNRGCVAVGPIWFCR